MAALYRDAVVALAGRIQLGQPIPGPASGFWTKYGVGGIIEQSEVIVTAQDVVAAGNEFGTAPQGVPLSDIYGGSAAAAAWAGVGPNSGVEADIWATVRYRQGGKTKFFSTRLSVPWSDLMADVDLALEDEVQAEAAKYKILGGGPVTGIVIETALVF